MDVLAVVICCKENRELFEEFIGWDFENPIHLDVWEIAMLRSGSPGMHHLDQDQEEAEAEAAKYAKELKTQDKDMLQELHDDDGQIACFRWVAGSTLRLTNFFRHVRKTDFPWYLSLRTSIMDQITKAEGEVF